MSGSIVVRGPSVMDGYFEHPAATTRSAQRRLAAHRRSRLSSPTASCSSAAGPRISSSGRAESTTRPISSRRLPMSGASRWRRGGLRHQPYRRSRRSGGGGRSPGQRQDRTRSSITCAAASARRPASSSTESSSLRRARFRAPPAARCARAETRVRFQAGTLLQSGRGL